VGHFLRSGFREEGAELPRFPAIIKGTQLDFSATLTLWRCTQSRANRSLLWNPCRTGKNTGAEHKIPIHDHWAYTFYLLCLKELFPMGTLGGTGIIIDVSGMKVLEEN
jgi:hypothetical protein